MEIVQNLWCANQTKKRQQNNNEVQWRLSLFIVENIFPILTLELYFLKKMINVSQSLINE